MNNNLYYSLLIKLPNDKVIQTSKLDFYSSTIQMLKLEVSYRSNIPYNRIELYWNNEILSPESLLLKNFEVNGEKLPINKFNVNNLIFLEMD